MTGPRVGCGPGPGPGPGPTSGDTSVMVNRDILSHGNEGLRRLHGEQELPRFLTGQTFGESS